MIAGVTAYRDNDLISYDKCILLCVAVYKFRKLLIITFIY